MIQSVIGHNDQVRSFLKRFGSGRFPHAWLFDGPEGIGKTMTAHLLASVVLGAKSNFDSESFSVSRDEVTQRLASESHPDFRYLRRVPDDNGKLPQNISVESIRKMNHFFELKASEGGYRVAIVDSVDEFNANSANALLKTLEEPPARCLIIMIYHGRKALLQTIRSRCVRLKFNTLSEQNLDRCLADEGVSDIAQRLKQLSEGSPGRLRRYLQADPDGALLELIQNLEKSWPRLGGSMMTALQSQLGKSDTHLELGMRGIDQLIEHRARQAEDWKLSVTASSAWSDMQSTLARGDALKLDLSERSASCLTILDKLAKTGTSV